MRHRLAKLLKTIYPSLAWTLFILLLLCLPGQMLPAEEDFSIGGFDKIVHAVLFGGFVVFWCLYLAANKYSGALSPGPVFVLFIISCVFGIAMEYVQKYWIPGRDFDPLDMVADCSGAVIGAGAMIAGRKRWLVSTKK